MALQETQRARRGHGFYPRKSDRVPALGSQDGKGYDAVVRVRYFAATGADWFITEWNPETGEAFGWAEILPGCGELGYTHLPELEAVNAHGGLVIVERDCYWTPVTLQDAIDKRALVAR